MTKVKKIISMALAAVMMLSLCACGNAAKQDETTAAPTTAYQSVKMNVLGLKGPTGMGMAKLIADDKASKTANDYNVSIIADPTQIASAITTGEQDIVACPLNMSAALYNKTKGGVQVLAVNTLGTLYILDKTGTVKSLADLKGKTIVTSGQGATPEYAINYILDKNGLKDDVKVEYLSEHSEVATAILTGKADIVMLPEPNVTVVTTKNSDIKIAINLTDEWNKVSDAKLAMGCIIGRTEYIKQNPAAVAKFLEEYKASVDFINSDATAGQLIADAGILDAAPIAQKAIKTSNITFVSGADMKTMVQSNLNVLFTANPKSVGGAMPNDDFYYTAK